ncbi:MAG TPA: glycosyltransferase family 2 protein [Wenzhouxiangellaceae bacterium]|nr:glycosyltransferase family 2 protein [Wenzhouxiangellaceae bacterium]
MSQSRATKESAEGEWTALPGGSVSPIRLAQRHVVVVIPAQNEESDVGEIVERVLRTGFAAVVVDDYSSDRTRAVAREAGATVLELPFHAGAWAAIQTGMRYARRRGATHVVTLDADGQHNPEDIHALMDVMDKADAPNVVIGACVSRANRRRRLAWRALSWLSGLQIDDLTSGFRMYDRAALDLLVSHRHSLLEYQDIGVLLCLRAHDLSFREVAVPMRRRLHGISRIFNSWPMVAYYLIYSTLIGGSRRSLSKDMPK